MPGRTRRSHGDTAQDTPTPLYQQVIVLKCPVGCTHNLMLSSRDGEEVRALAGHMGREFAGSGIACMITEVVSWFPHHDIDVRSPGFAERCAYLLRQIDAAQEDQELAF